MDPLQNSLITEYVAQERYERFLIESEALRRTELAQTRTPWRERLAQCLVTLALCVAPRDSALHQQTSPLRMLLQG